MVAASPLESSIDYTTPWRQTDKWRNPKLENETRPWSSQWPLPSAIQLPRWAIRSITSDSLPHWWLLWRIFFLTFFNSWLLQNYGSCCYHDCWGWPWLDDVMLSTMMSLLRDFNVHCLGVMPTVTGVEKIKCQQLNGHEDLQSIVQHVLICQLSILNVKVCIRLYFLKGFLQVFDLCEFWLILTKE